MALLAAFLLIQAAACAFPNYDDPRTAAPGTSRPAGESCSVNLVPPNTALNNYNLVVRQKYDEACASSAAWTKVVSVFDERCLASHGVVRLAKYVAALCPNQLRRIIVAE